MTNDTREPDAVRTTIVGGRPPGNGMNVGAVPHGIEVLVKKASVDPAFRAVLLEKRAEAAREIALELSPAEALMLNAAPADQLLAIIAATQVPPSHVPAFLGKVAAVMLAAIGLIQGGCDQRHEIKGIAPDKPRQPTTATSRPSTPPVQDNLMAPRGIQPDRPRAIPTTTGIRPDRTETAPPQLRLRNRNSVNNNRAAAPARKSTPTTAPSKAPVPDDNK